VYRFASRWTASTPSSPVGDRHSSVSTSLYRRSMIELWLLTPVVLSWWLWSGRAVATLGLGVEVAWHSGWSDRCCCGCDRPWTSGRVGSIFGSSASTGRKQFQGISALMLPRDRRERRLWWREPNGRFLRRSYLPWFPDVYLMMWLPQAAAVVVSAVVFGLAHLYLGWAVGVLRAAVVVWSSAWGICSPEHSGCRLLSRDSRRHERAHR